MCVFIAQVLLEKQLSRKASDHHGMTLDGLVAPWALALPLLSAMR